MASVTMGIDLKKFDNTTKAEKKNLLKKLEEFPDMVYDEKNRITIKHPVDGVDYILAPEDYKNLVVKLRSESE